MTEQTPSGNRWEPEDPQQPAVSAYAAETPPPAPADPERPSRWRTRLRRPSRQTWVAAGLSALMVFVGLGGFLAGRASVEEQPGPPEVGQEWHRGPGQGDLPGRPFDGDSYGPGGSVPGTAS